MTEGDARQGARPSEYDRYAQPADEERLRRVVAALRTNGMQAEIVDDGEAARDRVLAILPPGSSVLTASSRTLELTGLMAAIEERGRYRAVRPQYLALDKASQADEIRRMRAAPDTVIGSVHAVTEAGTVVIASQTGSQLAPYAYGAGRVIWVVGAQKVVRDLDEGLRRIAEYAYPLEDARSREVYGTPSGMNKLLIVNREIRPGRISVVLIRKAIGF